MSPNPEYPWMQLTLRQPQTSHCTRCRRPIVTGQTYWCKGIRGEEKIKGFTKTIRFRWVKACERCYTNHCT